MCLTLRYNYKTPYNRKKIRWKVVVDSGGGELRGPYQYTLYKRAGLWNEAFGKKDVLVYPYEYESCGFHVYYTRSEARIHVFKNHSTYKKLIIKKVQVDDFLASGLFNKRRSETWRKMKILKD